MSIEINARVRSLNHTPVLRYTNKDTGTCLRLHANAQYSVIQLSPDTYCNAPQVVSWSYPRGGVSPFDAVGQDGDEGQKFHHSWRR